MGMSEAGGEWGSTRGRPVPPGTTGRSVVIPPVAGLVGVVIGAVILFPLALLMSGGAAVVTATYEVLLFGVRVELLPWTLFFSLVGGVTGLSMGLLYFKVARKSLEAEGSSAFLNWIIDSMDFGLITVDREYRVLTENASYRKHLDAASDDAEGEHCYQIGRGHEVACHEVGKGCPVQEAFDQGCPATVVQEHVTDGGEKRFIELSAHPLRNDSGEIVAAVELSRDVTERERIREENTLLLDITRKIGEAPDFEAALDQVLGEIFAATGWGYGEAWTPDSSHSVLSLSDAGERYLSGGLRRFRESSLGVELEPGEGLPGRVWRTGEPEWIPDVSTATDEAFPRADLARDAGLHAAFAVPITSGGELNTVLVFFLFESRPQDTHFVEGVSTVATQLGKLLERKRLEQRLKTRNEELQVLNRVLRHDIRNQMAVITGWGEILEHEIELEQRETFDKILCASRDVVRLTETARDLIDAMEQDEPETRPVNLAAVLERELATACRFHGEEIYTLDAPIPEDLEVQAGSMLGSVFRNLLHNAVQHSDKEEPRVRVEIEQRGDVVVVRIADNGPGIPDDRKEEVFGKGEKGLESEGTGVGLYLVATLVEQYGGEVRIEDNEPEGAVFEVELKTVDSE